MGMGEDRKQQNQTTSLTGESLPPAFARSQTLEPAELQASFAKAVGAWLVRTPSPQTRSNYARDLHQFLRFCKIDSGHIEELIRHQRRALKPDEVKKLIDSARSSGQRIQGYSGEARARVYLMSFLTGLRRSELASLTAASFDLKSKQPTLTVLAACSKHRRTDVLPLHPELVVVLANWLKDVKPGGLLFPKLERKKTWLMVKKDLERVGIPYETAEGIADFHAAGRHTHITELLRNGATLPEAKELARHTDVKMTMRYTHIGMRDQANALASLPSPKPAPISDVAPNPSQQFSQQSGGSNRQTVAKRVTGWQQSKKNPAASKPVQIEACDAAGQSAAEPGTDSAQWRRRELNPQPFLGDYGKQCNQGKADVL